jgi:hypothetical protein
MFENTILSRIFPAKGDGVIEGLRELLKLEFHNFNFSSNILGL